MSSTCRVVPAGALASSLRLLGVLMTNLGRSYFLPAQRTAGPVGITCLRVLLATRAELELLAWVAGSMAPAWARQGWCTGACRTSLIIADCHVVGCHHDARALQDDFCGCQVRIAGCPQRVPDHCAGGTCVSTHPLSADVSAQASSAHLCRRHSEARCPRTPPSLPGIQHMQNPLNAWDACLVCSDP